jgi:deoxyribose-phosphate aldolase
MPDLDFEICDGKSFRDLCRDILSRSDSKKNQVDILYTDMRQHIKDASSALNFVPQLKALIETGIKNDEQLVKLAAILQRLQSTQIEATGGEGGGGLSEEDKAQLMREVSEVKKETDKPINISETDIN